MLWQTPILVAYLGVLALLCVVGLHRLRLVATGRRATPLPEPVGGPLPCVTVQLPVFDERYVVERLVAAAGAIDWPADRLQIQILDDSTDDTTARAESSAQLLRDRGLDAVVIHRANRHGYKAGALAEGLLVAKGDFVAIFDADFVPAPDFLRRTVPAFADPRVGMVQARWGHLDPQASWLTEAQATLLDAHFCVEHAARHALGRWFNFNGTAGIWRKDAIIDAGGWSAATLTEDLELSYRAQMRGWSFVYLDDLVVPAELPADMTAFRSQQRRWAKGSVQTARRLLGPIWRSDAPFATKTEATFHLAANAVWPLALALCALLPLSIVARGGTGLSALQIADLALFAGSTGSAFAVYAVAIWRSGDRRWRRFAAIPVAMALGIGMSLAQTRAALEGLRDGGVFVRTPKRGASDGGYRLPIDGLVVGELALGAYVAAGGAWALAQGYIASLPFILLVAGGFVAVAGRALSDASQARARTTGTHVANHSQDGSRQDPDVTSNAARTA